MYFYNYLAFINQKKKKVALDCCGSELTDSVITNAKGKKKSTFFFLFFFEFHP